MTRVLAWRGRENALEENGLGYLKEDAEVVIDLLRAPDDIVYVDIDPVEIVFAECAERIRKAWEEAWPEESHLGHAAVGKWIFYWLFTDLRSILDLLRENDASSLRTSATDFIDAGFGDRGPKLSEVPEHVPAAFLV